MLNGLINLNKPKGISSNKAISILKKHLRNNNIKTKVGHFGTLDPMAEGVLPIALGRATRLFDYFIDKRKEYCATFMFGITTDTLDSEGQVVKECDKTIDSHQIEQVLLGFIGEINQLPPKYSAKLVDGKRAYDLARKGVEFQLTPKKIIIYDIKLIKKLQHNTFQIFIACSGGTYIRAIVRDVAEKLNTVGVMTALQRVSSGNLCIGDSVTFEQIESDIRACILPLEYILTDFDSINVSSEEAKKLRNGLKLSKKDLPIGRFCVYTNNKLIGMGINIKDRLVIKTWLI